MHHSQIISDADESKVADRAAYILRVELLVLLEEHERLYLVSDELELARLGRKLLWLLWEGKCFVVYVSDLVLVPN